MKKLSYIFLIAGCVAAHSSNEFFTHNQAGNVSVERALVKDCPENVNCNTKFELSEDEFKNFLTERYARVNCKVLTIKRNGDDFTVQIFNEMSGEVTKTMLNIEVVKFIKKLFMQKKDQTEYLILV